MSLCQAFRTTNHDLDNEAGLIKAAVTVGLLGDGQVDVAFL